MEQSTPPPTTSRAATAATTADSPPPPAWVPRHNGHSLTHFYHQQFSEQIRNRRFRMGIYRTSFLLRNLQDAETPDALMLALLAHLIDVADFNSGSFPERFSVIIRSEVLRQPIQVPYADFQQNSPETIMELFERVEQSGTTIHGRPSLYSRPLHIEVVMGPGNDEVLGLIHSATRMGSGRPHRNVIHNINRSALIEVMDPREWNVCLFMAVELSRRYASIRRGDRNAQKSFMRLVNGTSPYFREGRRTIALDLLRSIRNQLGVELPADLPAYSVEEHVPLIQRYFDTVSPTQYRLVVFGQYGRYKPLWKGEKKAHIDVPIFLENGHFIGIRQLSAFFGIRYYCVDCEGPYERVSKHRAQCKSLCIRCWGKGFEFPCPISAEGYFRNCENCLIPFFNPRCFDRHLEARMCAKRRKCATCGQVYLRSGEAHVCYVQYCRVCTLKHAIKEDCYVQKIVPNGPMDGKPYLLIIYDFECTTHTPVGGHVGAPTERAPEYPEEISTVEEVFTDEDGDGDGIAVDGGDFMPLTREEGVTIVDDDDENIAYEHHVNCVSAYLTCSSCVRKRAEDDPEGGLRWLYPTTGGCPICGPDDRQRMRTWIIGGDAGQIVDPVDEFLRWILYGLPGGVDRTVCTYAFAHYSGRYDIHLVAGAIYRLGGLWPRIIRSGNKIYELALERRRAICPDISFRDTYNWIGMGLAEIPAALDLGDGFNKPFFPHAYNRNENLDIQLPALPPPETYFPEGMKRKKREQFEAWYTANSGSPFCLREQLRVYCENDVMLLAHAVVRFQSLFRSLARSPALEDDVVAKCLTIASACIRHFCINHLVPGQIAIIPDQGYHKRDVQSAKGLKFLRWYAHHHGLDVQHRDSGPEGEHRLRITETGETFRLDGYVRRQPTERDIALEFNGHIFLYIFSKG